MQVQITGSFSWPKGGGWRNGGLGAGGEFRMREQFPQPRQTNREPRKKNDIFKLQAVDRDMKFSWQKEPKDPKDMH